MPEDGKKVQSVKSLPQHDWPTSARLCLQQDGGRWGGGRRRQSFAACKQLVSIGEQSVLSQPDWPLQPGSACSVKKVGRAEAGADVRPFLAVCAVCSAKLSRAWVA